MEKVLVGLDEEAASQTAVDWVIDRARRTPMHVTLYTAFDMIVSDVVADGELLRSTAERITDAAPGTVVETVSEEPRLEEPGRQDRRAVHDDPSLSPLLPWLGSWVTR